MRGSEEFRSPRAVVLTIGTELAEGMRPDTNGPEISRRLAAAGYLLAGREVLPDDRDSIASRIAWHLGRADLLVVTGGLGPTHDDVTREGAAAALCVTLESDPALADGLKAVSARHRSREGAVQVMRQALVLPGAEILGPATGTAPGQLVPVGEAFLLLLPGPPHEMRPLLTDALRRIGTAETSEPRIIHCVHIAESDAQIEAESVLASFPGIELTVLASPSLVDIVLIPRAADGALLDSAARAIADRLGRRCVSSTGATLAETVIRSAAGSGRTLALAESCTGGLVSAALSSVPGASGSLLGGFITYSDALKTSILGVPQETLERYGAVSEIVACQMADGARASTGADLTVAITGIAGPEGGTPDKPVGTVWLAIAGAGSTRATHHRFSGDRSIVRSRATVAALDMFRIALDYGDRG